jgi:hypothetical protein
MSNTVPNGILANQFWAEAKAFLDAAKVLIDAGSSSAATYFLLCHALELTIKSYLLAKDTPLDTVVRLRHNFVEAHTRAQELGLNIEGEHADALIQRLSEFHNQMIFRYPVLTRDEGRLVLRGHLVRTDELHEFVDSVCKKVLGPVLIARIDASSAGEFPIETWHMGLPSQTAEEDAASHLD